MNPAFLNFSQSTDIYKAESIRDMIKRVRKHFRFSWKHKKLKYFNVPMAFDIEASSFYTPDGKRACMYIWTLGIYGLVCYGRTWKEFVYAIDTIADELKTTLTKRCIIYVHNLAYDFQFFRHWLEWEKIFALDIRIPVYAITTHGIEFRCSYIYSGYSLETIGKNLHTYKAEKKTGDLDYKLVRHSTTQLTDTEMAYCVCDVKVLMSYIQEEIEQYHGIAKLEITKTGKVRTYCRNSCFYDPDDKYKKKKYHDMILSLCVFDESEYNQQKRGFQGGFTHSNCFYTGEVVRDVLSMDINSSYPFTLVSEMFPMSGAETVEIHTKEEFIKNLKTYCCLFDVKFIGLESQIYYESYISSSRCYRLEGYTLNNGRVVKAGILCTTITDVDYRIISRMYTWEHMEIRDFRRYKKGYLPTDFVKSVLKLYNDKTTLKGTGNDIVYQSMKEMLNSCYGMAVTDIIHDIIEYTDDWEKPQKPDIAETLEKYNKNHNRFLYYPWGIWVTAYARRNLFSAILEVGVDYVYADTDSVKFVNGDKHTQYFVDYEKKIYTQLEKAMKHHGLSMSLCNPVNAKGKQVLLGNWDFDGHYSRFMTLGAKRYMIEYSDDSRNEDKKGMINITVSGLNKKKTVPYLKEKYGDPFKAFRPGLYIPPQHTGRTTHTYIDDETQGDIVDYIGVKGSYHERSSIHIEEGDYELSLSYDYIMYLMNIKQLTNEGRVL